MALKAEMAWCYPQYRISQAQTRNAVQRSMAVSWE